MKTIRDLLNQFNAEVSLFLSLLGIGLGLGFSNDSVTILKWILFFLFISNAYLLIGGPSVFLMKLEPQGDSSPFVYKHNLAEIAQSKDFAYKFKRKLT